MKYKFTLNIGFPGAKQEEIIDIEDYYDLKEWKEMTETDKETCLLDWWNDWSEQYIDGGWEEVE